MHIKWPAINFEGSAESVDERKTRLPLLSPSSSFPSTSLSLSFRLFGLARKQICTLFFACEPISPLKKKNVIGPGYVFYDHT